MRPSRLVLTILALFSFHNTKPTSHFTLSQIMTEDVSSLKQKQIWFMSGSRTFRIYTATSTFLRYLEAIFRPSNNVNIQGVPGGKDNILGGHSIGHSKQNLYMNMCPIPNGFRDRAILVVWLGRLVLSFPPALLREGRSIFWEVIVSVILSKIFIWTCVLFRTVSEVEPF
jgi:hypothetical protein